MDNRKWFIYAIICAVIYPIVGIVFGALGNPSVAPALRTFWRLAAWCACAVTFGVHFFYECRLLHSRVLATAAHTSLAVALGASLLAVWINIHGLWAVSAHHSPLAPLALVIFPLVTGVPAFFVALVAGAMLNQIGPR